MSGKVFFIGAGPGAPDLLTIRGRDAICRADVVIWADSLVHPEVAALARPDAEVLASSSCTLEEVADVMLAAARAGKVVARVHSGDPSIYGAMHEQLAILEREGVTYEIVPGVSSAFAAAARLGVELTVPDVAQTVIFTRIAGRTTLPEGERLRDLARHGTTLALFLSVAHIERVIEELRAGGYPDQTPVGVVYRASWEDERVLQGTIADIAPRVKAAGLQLQAVILVGGVLEPGLRAQETHRSNLYAPGYSHRFRKGQRPAPAAFGD